MNFIKFFETFPSSIVGHEMLFLCFNFSVPSTSRSCKLEVIVQGDEGPVGGVAQVVCHGVIVVVGHQEEGQEEKGETRGEVEGEVEKLKDNRTSWMVRRRVKDKCERP